MRLDKGFRNHWSNIVTSLIKNIFDLAFLFVIAFFSGPKILILALGLLVVAIIISILSWRNFKVYIKNEMLVSEKGVFNKVKQEIPFEKITTINSNQGIMDRIFGVTTLKIDTGAVNSTESEVKISLKTNIAEKLKSEILSNNSNEEILDYCEAENIQTKEVVNTEHEDVVLIKAGKKSLTLYALTKGKLGWIGGMFLLLTQVDEFFNGKLSEFANSNSEGIISSIESNIERSSVWTIIILIFIGLLIAYILCAMISIISKNIKFYDYKVYKSNDKINIEYGLITKKKFSMPISKIQSIKFTQNITQQLLGVYNMEAVVIGYGGNEGESTPMLYPIANEDEKNKIIDELIPRFKFNGDLVKPNKNVKSKFIFKQTIITFISVALVLYFIEGVSIKSEIIILSIATIISVLLGLLNYKNTSIGLNDDIVMITSGSRTKRTYYVLQKNVQSVCEKQNIFQKKYKVCNYIIDICTNTFGETLEVKHISKDLFEEINKNLQL